MVRAIADRLQDIHDAAVDLRDFVAEMETQAFHDLPHADRMGFRAVKNALAELGEAVKALPADLRKRHPNVDWRGFAGLRDQVAHNYHGLSTGTLRPICRREVPQLLAAVEAELARLSKAP
jgi:uncharacterized protein with HEPN domain